MKIKKIFLKWVGETFDKLSSDLLNEAYSITVVDKLDIENSSGYVFAVQSRPEYRDVILYVYRPALERYISGNKEDIKYLKDGLIHEICHIIISRVSNVAENRYLTRDQLQSAVEETAESLAITMRKLYKNT